MGQGGSICERQTRRIEDAGLLGVTLCLNLDAGKTAFLVWEARCCRVVGWRGRMFRDEV